MSWLIYIFGSGWAFFVGTGLVLVATPLLPRARGGWRASLVSIVALVGLVVLGLSAVPLSYWLYAAIGIVTLAWLIAERRHEPAATDDMRSNAATRLRWGTMAILVGVVVLEAPYLLAPRVSALGNPPLYIIGDSVTAGADSGEKLRWPELLPESIKVHDLAQMGATASSARTKQCVKLPDMGGLVLLEIGGNDLLGDTPAIQFERDLDQLLAEVAAPNRTIVMFELPLPPLYNEYGRIQRRLAARHTVQLIPKRIFMSVLAGEDATLDSIHLSPRGHDRMAAAVWNIIEPAYRSADSGQAK